MNSAVSNNLEAQQRENQIAGQSPKRKPSGRMSQEEGKRRKQQQNRNLQKNSLSVGNDPFFPTVVRLDR